jgi:hypothetical protein
VWQQQRTHIQADQLSIIVACLLPFSLWLLFLQV